LRQKFTWTWCTGILKTSAPSTRHWAPYIEVRDHDGEECKLRVGVGTRNVWCNDFLPPGSASLEKVVGTKVQLGPPAKMANIGIYNSGGFVAIQCSCPLRKCQRIGHRAFVRSQWSSDKTCAKPASHRPWLLATFRCEAHTLSQRCAIPSMPVPPLRQQVESSYAGCNQRQTGGWS